MTWRPDISWTSATAPASSRSVNMSVADAVSACWDCKRHFGFWRPITAIHMAGEWMERRPTAAP